MEKTMKAAVLKSPHRLEVVDLPIPEPSNNEALVKVKAAAICHTDIEIYQGKIPATLPIVLGHEISGYVVKTGKDVSKVKEGDRVVIRPGGIIGRIRNGGFAEYVAVPENLLYKLPENISYEEGALIELLWTVYHGHRRANIGLGDSVAILGLGAAGLLHLMLSKLSGAHPIIGVDINKDRLKLAEILGADYVLDSKEVDVVKAIMEITHEKGVDVVIEAAGVLETFDLALNISKYGGRILLFGILTEPIEKFDAYRIYAKELTIIGSRAMLESEYEVIYNLLSYNKVNLKPLISSTITLEKLPEIFDQLSKRQLQAIRIIVIP